MFKRVFVVTLAAVLLTACGNAKNEAVVSAGASVPFYFQTYSQKYPKVLRGIMKSAALAATICQHRAFRSVVPYIDLFMAGNSLLIP